MLSSILPLQSQIDTGQQSLQHTGQRVRAEMKRYHDMGQDDTDNEIEELVSQLVIFIYQLLKWKILSIDLF